MKYLVVACVLNSTVLTSQSAQAGGIEKACLIADRSAASRSLCGCIEDVASAMLSRKEQSRVVKFFKYPHQSQSTRQSDRASDERFWTKYKKFGQAVRTYCES